MERLHNSKKPLRRIRGAGRQPTDMKPEGLWYGIDREWEDWCRSEMPSWIGPYTYRLEVVEERLLVLRTPEEILEFSAKYAKPGAHDPKHVSILWPEVARKYGGIEITPYQWSLRHRLLWYYTWDVASGCIWDRGIITNFERVHANSKAPAIPAVDRAGG